MDDSFTGFSTTKGEGLVFALLRIYVHLFALQAERASVNTRYTLRGIVLG